MDKEKKVHAVVVVHVRQFLSLLERPKTMQANQRSHRLGGTVDANEAHLWLSCRQLSSLSLSWSSSSIVDKDNVDYHQNEDNNNNTKNNKSLRYQTSRIFLIAVNMIILIIKTNRRRRRRQQQLTLSFSP